MEEEDDPKCSVCGAPAVAVIDLDTDEPDWRCEAHVDDPELARALSRVNLLDDLHCIACGKRAEVARFRGGALVGYCAEHAEDSD